MSNKTKKVIEKENIEGGARFMDDGRWSATGNDLVNVLGPKEQIKDSPESVELKKKFASDLMKAKGRMQRSLMMNTNLLFGDENKETVDTRQQKLEIIENSIADCFDLLKEYLQVDFIAYSSFAEIYKLFKDGSFNFTYKKGDMPTKLNPMSVENCMVQAENCYLESGKKLSYYKDSGHEGISDMIYMFKGHLGDTIGYLLCDGLSEETLNIAKTIFPVFYREVFHMLLERQNIVLNKQLEKSELDQLTGLKRRDSLMHKCREILDRNARLYEQNKKQGIEHIFESSIAMLDVDDFKKVNDTYGHLVGDWVLQKLAKTLKSNSRQTDKWYWYRYGGEEFVGIFDLTNLQGALACLNRIQAADKSVELTDRDDKKKIDITMSVGVATITAAEIEFYNYLIKTIFVTLKRKDLLSGATNAEIQKSMIEVIKEISIDLNIFDFDIADLVDIEDMFTSIINSIENISGVNDIQYQEFVDEAQNGIKDIFINNVIKRADDALYTSKHTGKNKITVDG